jgi:type IV pilus assembly protein PilY1
VTNAQITAGSVGYASSYNSGSWYGDLEAYSLDLSTGLQNGAIQWSARDRLNAQAASTRKIASFNGKAGAAFTTTHGDAFRKATPALTDGLINYIRGDRTGEGTTYRARTYLLGDIINAEPVVVNYASSGAAVFQASNDGMLHVFDGRIESSVATRGQELWAYVPQLIHGKLPGRASLSFEHEYLVDGTPATAEISGADALKRILVGGLNKGGAGYYGLDITSGTAATEANAVSKVLWEFKPANMGYSFGIPLIVSTSTGWKVVVASGYRNDTAPGGLGGDGRGHVWVLNPGTGEVEKEFITPTGWGSESASLGLAHLGRMANVPADSVVRYVYGGDLLGNVWRFDLDAATLSAPVHIAAVSAPDGSSQPITVPPVIGPVSGSATKQYIYFGTGQYFSMDDVPGTATANAFARQAQTFYGIVDDTSKAAPTLPNIRGTNGNACPKGGGDGDLVCQAATQASASSPYSATHHAVNLSVKRGFYMDVPITGGRVNNQAALTSKGTLVFVVNKPSNVVCNPGGSSYYFQLSAGTGGAVAKSSGGDVYFDVGFALADALSSRAVLVRTSTGPRAVFRLSDKTTQSREIDEEVSLAGLFKRVYKRALN